MKFMALFISLSMITSAAITVSAEDTIELRGDFYYETGTNIITSYEGESTEVVIPEGCEINGLGPNGRKITKLTIGKDTEYYGYPLSQLTSLETLVFEEGVTEIPDKAFQDCPALKEVVFPSTLKEIGEEAFCRCGIKSLKFSEGLEKIGDNTFRELRNLSGDIIFPNSCKYIGSGSFYQCGAVDKVYLPDTLEFFNSFGSTDIKEINIPDSMLSDPPVMHGDEITFNSDMTVAIYSAVMGSDWFQNKYLTGKTDKTLGDYEDFIIIDNVLLKYMSKDRNPKVPEGVTRIFKMAFRYADIDSVEFPSTLLEIDQLAFARSAIKTVTIPKNVKKIGLQAFDNCPMLEKVVIEGAPEIGMSAIAGTSKTIVELKDSSIVLPDDFYQYQGTEFPENIFYQWAGITPPETESTEKPTETPESTETPKQTQEPVSTNEPKNTATPEPTDMPVATEAPQPVLTVTTGSEPVIDIDGEAVTFTDAKPFIDENDRTMIPIRAVAEVLDCEVEWNESAREVSLRKDGTDVLIKIDDRNMTVNGNTVEMDTNAVIIDDRTYIPLRFAGEALGFTVNWK